VVKKNRSKRSAFLAIVFFNLREVPGGNNMRRATSKKTHDARVNYTYIAKKKKKYSSSSRAISARIYSQSAKRHGLDSITWQPFGTPGRGGGDGARVEE